MAEIRVELEVAAGRLPEVCARCGEPATTAKWRAMTWYPPWVNLLALLALLPAAIVAMILTKKASVKMPFCNRHSWHWLNRTLLMWGTFFLFGFIGLLGLIFAGAIMGNAQQNIMPFFCTTSVVLLISWLTLVVIVQATAIRPKEITDTEIQLAGLCQEFVDAVEEEEREISLRKKRARRIAQEDDEDEEDDEPRPRSTRKSTDVQESAPPPRKKRPPSEEIEE
jgi:hypothetical protein